MGTPKKPAKGPKKPVVKDLPAKDAGKVKGGKGNVEYGWKVEESPKV